MVNSEMENITSIIYQHNRGYGCLTVVAKCPRMLNLLVVERRGDALREEESEEKSAECSKFVRKQKGKSTTNSLMECLTGLAHMIGDLLQWFANVQIRILAVGNVPLSNC